VYYSTIESNLVEIVLKFNIKNRLYVKGGIKLKCKSCGAIVKPEETSCQTCGAALPNTGDEAIEENVSGISAEGTGFEENVDVEVTADDQTAAEGISEVEGEPDLQLEPSEVENLGLEDTENSMEEELTFEPVRKKTGLIAVLASLGVIVAGLAVYIGFFGGLDTITGLLGIGNNHPLVYIKDNAFYVKDGTKQAQKISEKIFNDETMTSWVADDSMSKNYTMIIKQRDNGKKLFYYDNIKSGNEFSGDLKMYELGGKPQKVAEGAYLGFAVSNDGKSVLYVQNYNRKNKAVTCIFTGTARKRNWASGVMAGGFKFSSDGKAIAYVENVDMEKNTWDLCVRRDGSQKEKIDSGTISLIDIENDGKSVYYVKPGENAEISYDLYVKEKGKQSKCIANNISDLTIDGKNKSLFILADYNSEKQSGTLYLKENQKDKVKVDENVIGLVKLGQDKFETETRFAGNGNSDALYIKDYNQESSTADIYYKHGGNAKVKVAAGAGLGSLQYSDDLSKIAFYKSDANSGEITLYTATASQEKTSYKENKVSDKLSNYGNMSKNGSLIVYTKKSGSDENPKEDLYIVKEDGKSEKIGSSVTGASRVSKDGKVVLFLEDNDVKINLCMKQSDKAKEIIFNEMTQNDRYYTYDFKNIYYTKGYDATSSKGELYLKQSGKDAEKIDTGVSIVLFSE
jgi:hypothetical protein